MGDRKCFGATNQQIFAHFWEPIIMNMYSQINLIKLISDNL